MRPARIAANGKMEVRDVKRPHAASPSARRRFASMETAPTMATTRRTAARQRRRCQPYGNCPKRHTNQEWVPGDAHNVLRRPVDQAFPRDGGGVRRGQADDDQQECRQHRCDGDRFPRPQLAPGGCSRGTSIRQNEPDHAGDRERGEHDYVALLHGSSWWRCRSSRSSRTTPHLPPGCPACPSS